MPDYDNKLSGALFKNDKGDNPKRPDYKGSYTDAEGKEFNVSAWLRTSKDNKPYMSFTMQPKEAKNQAHTPKQEYAPSDSNQDNLPF